MKTQRFNIITFRLLKTILAVFIIFTLAIPTTATAAGSVVSFKDICELSMLIKINNISTATVIDSNSPDIILPVWKEEEGGTGEELRETDLVHWTVVQHVSTLQFRQDKQPNGAKLKNLATKVVNTFGTDANYAKHTNPLRKMTWAYNPVLYTSCEHSTLAVDGDVQSTLDKKIRNFNGDITATATSNNVTNIFDSSNFNPEAGPAKDFLDGVFAVVSVIFYVASNLILILFLIQTTLDIFYLMFEWIRPFLSNTQASSAPNNGGASGVLKYIRLPICSTAAIEACNGQGSASGVNGALSKQNVFIIYIVKRAPVILCCCCYIILVSMGYWTDLISWLTGLVVKLLSSLLTIGQ